MDRVVVAAILLIFASSARAGELDIYEHNGSIIDWFVVGTDIQATYATPRPGMKVAGVKPGTVLFKGVYEGERIVGKAYAFKPGCPPAGYDVIGMDVGKQIVLRGPAPRRAADGCRVIGYSATSPHARLVLTFSVHHH